MKVLHTHTVSKNGINITITHNSFVRLLLEGNVVTYMDVSELKNCRFL